MERDELLKRKTELQMEIKKIDDELKATLAKSLTKKDFEILRYCSKSLEQMWAASIIGIILDCEYRDSPQRLSEYGL